MNESESRKLVFDGVEASLVLDALADHEPEAPETEAARTETLESEFDQDLADTEEAAFELTRADARLLLGALEEHEPLASEREVERINAMRNRLLEAFELGAEGTGSAEPLEDEQYPGSS